VKNVITTLKERGLIDALSSEELVEKANQPLKVYAGFDLTAESLHLGNFVTIITLAHFQRHGHTPVVLFGGATTKIGDPSGKSKERPLLDFATIEKNTASIRKHFAHLLDFNHPTAAPVFVNNEQWLGSYSLIDFLRDVGKHFRLGPMLAKESVRARLESEEGMSFTEFSYQLLQAYDFYHLLTNAGVSVQIGGSDQWGNITAGIELIRKLTGESGYGLTFPLLTRSDGKKFGKTEEGAIWLSAEKCSPYAFYQYLVRLPDSDVPKLMRMITFMDLEEIAEIEQEMQRPGYIPNTAQKRLAEELTRLIHGEEGLQIAERVTKTAAPGAETSLDVEELEKIRADMPHAKVRKEELVGCKFTEVAVKVGLISSKGEGVRLIKNGGAYLNNQRVEEADFQIESSHLLDGRFLLLASGKRKKILIEALA
jgi:tyrosyl-tRNA synthetase